MVVFMFVVCIFCRFLLFLLAVPSFPTRRSSDLGWQLHLGNHSTLVPSAKAYADGVVYALTPNELAALYKRDGICAFRSEEHTSELQSRGHLVCRLLLENKKRRELIQCMHQVPNC